MRFSHLKLLRSPKSGMPLKVTDCEYEEDGKIKTGKLSDGDNEWPIIDFIPRFVARNEYWDSFSFQWEKHPKILHAMHSGLSLYKDRFEKETKWPKNLNGETIIEAGCGPGAFTSFALETGATVISFDASTSVEENYRQNDCENLLVVQASIYEMPFVLCDKIYCFGVLQHTPDPERSFRALVKILKPGGCIATDIYMKVPLTISFRYNILKTKYFLRKYTTDMNPHKLYKTVTRYVKIVWPLCSLVQKIPYGSLLTQRLLIDDYSQRLTGMDRSFFKEFAIVDIFDMLSPAYDIPVKEDVFHSWHKEVGLENIEVHPGYNGLEGRGCLPKTK